MEISQSHRRYLAPLETPSPMGRNQMMSRGGQANKSQSRSGSRLQQLAMRSGCVPNAPKIETRFVRYDDNGPACSYEQEQDKVSNEQLRIAPHLTGRAALAPISQSTNIPLRKRTLGKNRQSELSTRYIRSGDGEDPYMAHVGMMTEDADQKVEGASVKLADKLEKIN